MIGSIKIRLLKRGTDLKGNIEERLSKAKKEISLKNNFDIFGLDDRFASFPAGSGQDF